MQISTKGRYALRMMANLATLRKNETRSIRDIAEAEDISDKYLEQIIRPIAKAGLVGSVRGVQGGYYLKLPPEKITVGEVLRAVEGDLAPVQCLCGDTPETCERMDECTTIAFWREVNEAMNNIIDNRTLADLTKSGNK